MKPKDKKTVFCILSLSLLFCTILSGCLPKPNQNSSSEGQVSVPEELQELQNNPNTKYLMNIYVQYPGNQLRESEKTEVQSIPEYDYSGGELKLNVVMQNGLKGSVKTGLIVLCDGVPVKYTLDRTGETGLFHTFEVEGKIVEKITLTPNFVSKIGRMDFFEVYDLAAPGEETLSFNPCTVAMNLPENYEPDLTEFSVNEFSTAPMFESKKNWLNGACIGTWMYHSGAVTETDKAPHADLTFDLKKGGNVYVNFKAGETGVYRIVPFLDYEPFALKEGSPILEGELKKEEYASFLLPLKEMLSEGEHSFFALAIRLDGNSWDHFSLSTKRLTLLN